MIFGITFGLLITGCGGLRQSPKPMLTYALNYPPLNLTVEKRLPVVIKVDRFASTPGYGSSNMIYAPNLFERNAYTYRRWFATPSEMVAAALLQDLRSVGAFYAVILPGDRLQSTHILAGGITDFFEKEEILSKKAVLGVSILFFTEARPGTSQKIILQKQYHVETDFRQSNAEGFAEAMNRAVQAVSKQVILDLYQSIATQEE